MNKAIFVPIIGGSIAIGLGIALFGFGKGSVENAAVICVSAATVGGCVAIAVNQ